MCTFFLDYSSVGPCGWPIYISVWFIGSASLALMYPSPVSDSCIEIIKASITFLRTSMGGLCFGSGSSDCMGILVLLLK